MSGFALELQSMRKPRGVSVSNTRLRRLLLVPPILLLAMVAATGAAASPPPPASGAVVGMLLLLERFCSWSPVVAAPRRPRP
jgi:hypothetical protein